MAIKKAELCSEGKNSFGGVCADAPKRNAGMGAPKTPELKSGLGVLAGSQLNAPKRDVGGGLSR